MAEEKINAASAKDIADSFILKTMGKLMPEASKQETQASTASPAISSQEGGDASHNQETLKPKEHHHSHDDEHKVGDTGGKPPIPPSDHGHGGGGNGGSGKGHGGGQERFFAHEKWRNPQFVVSSIVALLGAIGLVTISFRTDYSKREETNKAFAQEQIAKANAKIAEETKAVPPGWIPPAQRVTSPSQQPQSVATPVIQPKVLVYATTFDCSDDVKRENGYARKNIQNLDVNSQSLRVGPGCVLVKTNGTISKLDAKDYELAVADPAIPGNFFKCSDADGRHDSVEYCAAFVNQYSGQEMRVAILNGGYVTFN